MSHREPIIAVFKHKLSRVTTRMKQIAECQFQIGDMVYLKLKPYIQNSMLMSFHSRLDKRCYGPYKVIEKIGVAAYKLHLAMMCFMFPFLN